jgi:hypothetical protein
LPNRLQNGTHRGKGGAADQSVHGRMGLGTAFKGETPRMKNVSIESSGGKNYVFGLRKTVYPQKNVYINIKESIEEPGYRLCYVLDDRGIGVQFPAGIRIFLFSAAS